MKYASTMLIVAMAVVIRSDMAVINRRAVTVVMNLRGRGTSNGKQSASDQESNRHYISRVVDSEVNYRNRSEELASPHSRLSILDLVLVTRLKSVLLQPAHQLIGFAVVSNMHVAPRGGAKRDIGMTIVLVHAYFAPKLP
jgi:hypothetical protein